MKEAMGTLLKSSENSGLIRKKFIPLCVGNCWNGVNPFIIEDIRDSYLGNEQAVLVRFGCRHILLFNDRKYCNSARQARTCIVRKDDCTFHTEIRKQIGVWIGILICVTEDKLDFNLGINEAILMP